MKEHFRYLADGPGSDALLDAIFATVRGVAADGDRIAVDFGNDRVLSASPPADLAPYGQWPSGFLNAVLRHGELAFPNRNGWGLILGDHGNYEGDEKSPLRDFSDWYVYDREQLTPLGEPAIAFVSHEGGGIARATGFGLGTTFLRRIAEILELNVDLPAPAPVAPPHAALAPVESDDEAATVLDETFVMRRLIGHRAVVRVVRFARDGRVISGSDAVDGAGEIRIWAAATGECVHLLRRDNGADVEELALSPDGHWLLAVQGGELVAWDSRTGDRVNIPPNRATSAQALGFSEDGTKAFALIHGLKPFVLSTTTWEVESGDRFDDEGGSAPTLSSRGLPAMAMHDKELVCVIEDGTPRELGRHKEAIYDAGMLAFSLDGLRLASADIGGLINVWDVASGACLATFQDIGRPDALAISADGELVLSASTLRDAESVRLWSVAQRRHIATWHSSELDEGSKSTGGRAKCVAFAVDGKTFAIGTAGGNVVLLHVA